MKYAQNLAVGVVFLGLGLALGSGVEEVTPVKAEPQPMVMPEPAAEPEYKAELQMESQQCVNGSCGVSSTPQSTSGPVRRVFQRRPLRRVLGRLFGR